MAFSARSSDTVWAAYNNGMADTNGHDAVTLVDTYDYLSLSGQEITVGQVDLSTDVTGDLAGYATDAELTSATNGSLTVMTNHATVVSNSVLTITTNVIQSATNGTLLVVTNHATVVSNSVLTIVTNGFLQTNTTQYGYLYVPAGAMLNVSNATFGTYSNGVISRDVLDFDDTAPEHAAFNSTLGDGWDLGTIRAKFHWVSATAVPATTNVVWMIRASQASDEAIGTTLGTFIKATNLGSATAYTFLHTNTLDITVGGTLKAGYPIDFEVARDPGNASDNHPGDARLLAVEIQYGYKIGNHTAW